MGFECTEDAVRAQWALHAFKGCTLTQISCFPPGSLTNLVMNYKRLIMCVKALVQAGEAGDPDVIQQVYHVLRAEYEAQKGFGGIS